MNFIDSFYDEERIFINKALEYKILSTFTKEEMLEDLTFYQAATPIDEFKEAYASAIKKIQALTSEEWEYLKKRYPLYVSYDYDADDEVDEVEEYD